MVSSAAVSRSWKRSPTTASSCAVGSARSASDKPSCTRASTRLCIGDARPSHSGPASLAAFARTCSLSALACLTVMFRCRLARPFPRQ